jgi:hypothetical protein
MKDFENLQLQPLTKKLEEMVGHINVLLTQKEMTEIADLKRHDSIFSRIFLRFINK